MKNESNYCKQVSNILEEFIIKVQGAEKYIFSAIAKQSKEILSYINKLHKERKVLQKSIKSVKEGEKEFNCQMQIDGNNYDALNRKIDETIYTQSLISNGVIVSLISIFDYYIRMMLKVTCDYLGDKFSNKDVEVKYNEIKYCDTIEKVRDYCIEKYLEGLFCGSHDKLFEEIKNKFNIENIKKSIHYKDLIFVAELRNIIVHNDSKTSITFKNRMTEFNIDYEKYEFIDEEEKIKLNPSQMKFVLDTLIYNAVYVALQFVLQFNKRDKIQYEEFLATVNEIALDYWKKKHIDLMIEIYDYLIMISKNSSDKFLYTINKCVGLKALGKIENMQNLLESLDWSNCEDKFKFAKNCLLNKTPEAIAFLKRQENKEEWKYYLQIWPLCVDLIRTDEFIEEYRNIFGEDFEKKIKVWNNTQKDINQVE